VVRWRRITRSRRPAFPLSARERFFPMKEHK
jgi:hypothetical protein